MNNLPTDQSGFQPSTSSGKVFRAGRRVFELGTHTYVCGILNVTPDSFSDGGRYTTVDTALRKIEEMVAAGADIIDIGGESTRPGSSRISSNEEIDRVIPIIEKATDRFPVPISIDTYKAQTAAAAIRAGATIVNDIFGLRADPDMASVLAASDAGAVLMFHPGLPAHLLSDDEKALDPTDWPSRMLAYLQQSIQLAESEGVGRDRLITDPGIGFDMTPETSVTVLKQSGCLQSLGLPVLIGTSRKRFIGHLLDGRPVDSRLMGTAASVCFAITAGADFVRVHDVAEMVDIVKVMDALYRERG